MRTPSTSSAAARVVRAALTCAELLGEARVAEQAATNSGPRARRVMRAVRLRRACEQGLGLLGVRVRVHGRVPDGPCVLVANHVSWLDPIVLCAHIAAVPIAKREVRGWPVVGAVCAQTGCLFVDRACARSGARALLQARAALRDGVPVLGFPEGTTAPRGTPLLPFRRGLFGLAARLRVPVIPLGVRFSDDVARWVGDDAFLPSFWGVARAGDLTADVRVGAPLHAVRGAPTSRLVKDAWDAVRALVDDDEPPRSPSSAALREAA